MMPAVEHDTAPKHLLQLLPQFAFSYAPISPNEFLSVSGEPVERPNREHLTVDPVCSFMDFTESQNTSRIPQPTGPRRRLPEELKKPGPDVIRVWIAPEARA